MTATQYLTPCSDRRGEVCRALGAQVDKAQRSARRHRHETLGNVQCGSLWLSFCWWTATGGPPKVSASGDRQSSWAASHTARRGGSNESVIVSRRWLSRCLAQYIQSCPAGLLFDLSLKKVRQALLKVTIMIRFDNLKLVHNVGQHCAASIDTLERMGSCWWREEMRFSDDTNERAPQLRLQGHMRVADRNV